MSVSIETFVGSWQFTSVGGINKLAQQGGYLLIGTNSAWGDTGPSFNPDNEVVVGFAVLDAQRNVLLSTANHAGEQPPLLMLKGDQLRWTGYYEQKPLRFIIAAAEIETSGGDHFISLFGNTIYGDPDQVAVWGSSGTAAPTPPGN